MEGFFPIRQFKHFPAAVKSMVFLTFFNVITPRFLKHLPQRFPLQNTRCFTLLFLFCVLHMLPCSRLRRFRYNFRFPEQIRYFPHNLTDQTDRRLFRFKTRILIVKTLPMLPHTPDRRSIIQHRFDLPQRCFRPFHNVLVTEIRQNCRFLFSYFFRERQERIHRNLPVTDQIMNACPFPRPFGKIPFQMFLVRTMKRHLIASSAQCHIERFSIQRFGCHHDVFGGSSLRLVGCRHPAVIECRVVLRHVDQLARSAVRIKYFDLAEIGAHPRQHPVVDFLLLEIHPELDQITLA